MLKIIEGIIKDRGVDLNKLCYGLCSPQSFGRYLDGERDMDRLFLNTILQRLKASPEHFVIALANEEYEYFEARTEIIRYVQSRNWNKAERLLNRTSSNVYCNKQLEKQFELVMRAVISKERDGNVELSYRLLLEAIEHTVPVFGNMQVDYSVLSMDEILIILSIFQLKQDLDGDIKLVQLENLMSDIMNEQDVLEKVKIYPIAVMIYANAVMPKGEYEKCITYCQNAIQLMRENNSSFMLENIFKLYIEVMEKTGRESEIQKEKEWLAAWQECIRLSGVQIPDMHFACTINFGQSVELIGEIIKKGRKEAGMTQEELAEQLNCDYVSLNRIEGGSRKPRRKRFKKAMQVLGIRSGKYYSDIQTDEYRAYVLKHEIDLRVTYRQYEKVSLLIKELRDMLDMDILINKQYVEMTTAIVENSLGRTSAKEYLEAAKKVLFYTVNINNKKISKRIFTNNEVDILIQIADALEEMDREEESIKVLEFLLDFYNNSKVDNKFHYRQVMVIINNLCIQYVLSGKYAEAMSLSMKGMDIDLNCFKGRMTASLINTYANILKKQQDFDNSLHCFKIVQNLAVLFKHDDLYDIALSNYNKVLEMLD